jgi:AIPR protein
LIQSKWSRNATKTIEEGDCQKFLKGIEQLIRCDFTTFNERIRKREIELTTFLKRSDVRITLVVAYSSSQDLSEPVKRSLAQFLEQQNNVGDTEVFSLEVLNLSAMYAYLSGSGGTNKIKMQIGLTEWGTVESPYRAYYGQVAVSEIETWVAHGKPLLDKNLRFYRGSTDINNAIEATLSQQPEHFWYFNNGITILCSKVEKTRLNGDSRNYGIFDCEGVSVANGGQTVGVIWEASRRPRGNQPSDAKVHVRLISLEKCPEDFGRTVTRGTNTQNPIQNRDFAALDPNQQRLAREMELDGKKYAFKSGDYEPKGDEGCNIEDATVALACAGSDVTLAVQAKREIGQLWRDIEKSPYTTLFNSSVQASHMWRAVRVLRAVSNELEAIDKRGLVRGELVAIHGNRFLLHLVFKDPAVRKYANPDLPIDSILDASKAATQRILTELAAVIEEKHRDSYLANLFKNAQKCKELVGLMQEKENEASRQPPAKQADFEFGDLQ